MYQHNIFVCRSFGHFQLQDFSDLEKKEKGKHSAQIAVLPTEAPDDSFG